MLPITVSQLKTANIAVFGNSISTEVYAPNAGWPRVMRNSLRAYCQSGALTVDWSASVSGQKTSEIYSAALWATRRKPGVVNIAIVFEGSNDLLHRGINSPSRVKDSADCLWNVAMALTMADWRVIVIGTTPRNHGYGANNENPLQYAADLIALDAMLKTYGDRTALFDFISIRDRLPQYVAAAPCCPDGVHPEAYGCWMIGYTVADYIFNFAYSCGP